MQPVSGSWWSRARGAWLWILVALPVSACASTITVGRTFHALTPAQHLATACRLEDDAAAAAKRYDPRATAPAPASQPERVTTELGMVTSAVPPAPATYNPTERYLVQARELRQEAQRHRRAAARTTPSSARACTADVPMATDYGGSWFLW